MRDLNERRPSSITSREKRLKRSIPSSRMIRSTASRIMWQPASLVRSSSR